MPNPTTTPAVPSKPLSASMSPIGVHFVGSIPLPTSVAVFHKLGTSLPCHIRRIPDGETGERGAFVNWQSKVFSIAQKSTDSGYQEFAAGSDKISKRELLQTGYDDAALASYETFKDLRTKGVIPSGVRFLVSLPTPLNVIAALIKGPNQLDMEQLYEKALLSSLRRIQDSIPATDLAIQWDCALEFAMLEGIWPAWFSPVQEGIVERLIRLTNLVDEEVEVGFHFCYGDRGHRHFIEPKDMSLMVAVANGVVNGVGNSSRIAWLHMPVPKDRHDEAYFEPLKRLQVGQDTELFLGLVHAGDEEGTRKRIETAKKLLGERTFGVGTECGMGRTPASELDDIVTISKIVSHKY